MKKYIYSFTAFFTMALCSAQVSISQAEYFWDTDPGQGLGVAISAVDGSLNSAFEQLSKTGITAPSVGLHKFCVRVKDNTNVWGPVFMNVINVVATTTATVVSISQAECFWDTDPGEGNGAALLAIDGNFSSAFEQLFKNGITIAQPVGLHVFNVRIKDNTGVWGPVFKNVVNIQSILGTENFNVAKLIVYPNPVKDLLNVSFDQKIIHVSLYNVLGQEVISRDINANDAMIDVSQLRTGTYLLKVQSGEDMKAYKVIKE
jgi:hypothetical protein